MDFVELKKKSEKELHDLLTTERGKLRDLQFKASIHQLKDVRAIRKAKTTIAQILTALTQHRSEENKTK